MAAATAGPVLLKLLGAGIQRGVSVLFQKVSRLRKIDLSFKGIASNDLVAKAVSDYETVLGTY